MRSEKKKLTDRISKLRQKARRQEAAGILPLWKACAAIDALMNEGANFSEAWKILQEVMEERGQFIRCDVRS